MDKMKNKSKVPTTIFKLVGPCKILSHGQRDNNVMYFMFSVKNHG